MRDLLRVGFRLRPQVAEMLERPAAWPRFQSLRDLAALKAELQAFVKEQGLAQGTVPPAAALRDAGRHELLNAINQAGARGIVCRLHCCVQRLMLLVWPQPELLHA